jgi:hypothetical protein
MSLVLRSKAIGRTRLLMYLMASSLVMLIAIGAMGRNGWLPRTDAMTGEKFGWFGSKLPKNAGSTWNPLAAPLPTATPQLSKEYIYAGSRMLAVVDANANETPPADLAVWRPSTGVWYVYNLVTTAWTSYSFGTSGDKTVPGDYDGDGKTDFAVARPNGGAFTWYFAYSSGGTGGFNFGNDTDKIAVADYDGDGKTDVAVYRQSTGVWYIIKSSDSSTITPTYGGTSDVPVPADFDGDGKADLALWRDSNHTIYSINSTDSVAQTVSIGSTGDKPVSADYDGDGKANYAVRSGASWIIYNAARTSTTTTTPIGDQSTDIPVQNDFDGDGKVDIAVWRPTTTPSPVGDWFIRQSGSGKSLRQEHWGTTDDIPVPAFWRR